MIEPTPTFTDLTRFHLAREVERWGWTVGAHSYGHPRVLEPEMARLHVGSFCSIGPNVTIVLGDHRTDFITTYPFKALSEFWPSAAAAPPDHVTRGDVVLGSDVWLGANCTVLSGVTVGSGAVVGAGAIVRHDVPPYAIVTGNPASVARFRFDERTIARLLRIAWWAWSDEKIAQHMDLLLSADVEEFINISEFA